MTTGREEQGNNKGTISFVLILLFAALFPAVIFAQVVESVVISAPATVQTSDYGMRVHPVLGVLRPHRGVDYRSACGTPYSPRYGGTLSCTSAGGYGNIGNVSHACGVTERYAHLQSCNAGTNSMLSGNTGIGTGCHLHYEIRINGVAVDPNEAYGQDLCDPAVQEALIADAQAQMNGNASGGAVVGGAGGGGSGPGAPPVLTPTTDEIVPETETDNELTGCGTDTWRAMVNQAVLQSRREMIMNQTFIAKPDSILAYSCFSDMFGHAAVTLGVFSESQLWVNRAISLISDVSVVNVELGQLSLDGAIANTTAGAYNAYMNTFFTHGFLGETDPLAPAGPQAFAPCTTMREVWQAAKCHNMPDGTFYRFQDLVGNDPRAYPAGYQCSDSGITQNMINRAGGAEMERSPLVTYLDILNNEGACSAPVMTGVTVRRQSGEGQITEEITYPDGLCLTAGCSYQNGGAAGVTGTCEVQGP